MYLFSSFAPVLLWTSFVFTVAFTASLFQIHTVAMMVLDSAEPIVFAIVVCILFGLTMWQLAYVFFIPGRWAHVLVRRVHRRPRNCHVYQLFTHHEQASAITFRHAAPTMVDSRTSYPSGGVAIAANLCFVATTLDV